MLRDRRPTPPLSGRRPRRERRGRGMRGGLAPPAVPVSRSRREAFDDLVLDAVDELEEYWAAEMSDVEFAVEEVPPLDQPTAADFESDVVLDRAIPLGRLFRAGAEQAPQAGQPVVVLYRRPIEARAVDRDDRADLVFMIVAELVAELLGRDVDEIDPRSG